MSISGVAIKEEESDVSAWESMSIFFCLNNGDPGYEGTTS